MQHQSNLLHGAAGRAWDSGYGGYGFKCHEVQGDKNVFFLKEMAEPLVIIIRNFNFFIQWSFSCAATLGVLEKWPYKRGGN